MTISQSSITFKSYWCHSYNQLRWPSHTFDTKVDSDKHVINFDSDTRFWFLDVGRGALEMGTSAGRTGITQALPCPAFVYAILSVVSVQPKCKLLSLRSHFVQRLSDSLQTLVLWSFQCLLIILAVTLLLPQPVSCGRRSRCNSLSGLNSTPPVGPPSDL